MLNWLFRRFTPMRIEDPYFGSLLFMKAPAGNVSYWEGKRAFEPTRSPIEVFIDTPTEDRGPTTEQRNFFLRVESAYPAILASVQQRLENDPELADLQIDLAAFDFAATSVSVPLCAQELEEWDLSFEPRSMAVGYVCAELRGEEVIRVIVQGWRSLPASAKAP